MSGISVAHRLDEVRVRIERVARDAGAGSITLVAVSKGAAPAQIMEAYEAGQRDFGENRVEELSRKASQLPEDISWHFVGRLQRNKAARLTEVALLHSLDRLALAESLSALGRETRTLVQVNVSGEHSKAGFQPGQAGRALARIRSLPRIHVAGLMTMAPFSRDPEGSRPVFRALRELRDRLVQEIPLASIHHLSMGMSQDYSVAIQEGATIVRIGEAIFGPKD